MTSARRGPAQDPAQWSATGLAYHHPHSRSTADHFDPWDGPSMLAAWSRPTLGRVAQAAGWAENRTAPDGGHRGPSTLQTPGGGVGAPAHSTPRGSVHTQIMGLLGGRLQTARKHPPVEGAHKRSAGHTRRWHPANGVPSDRETCELPSVNLLVAVGQARHDRSISGLPARGCPFVSRGRRTLVRRPSSCLLSFSCKEKS